MSEDKQLSDIVAFYAAIYFCIPIKRLLCKSNQGKTKEDREDIRTAEKNMNRHHDDLLASVEKRQEMRRTFSKEIIKYGNDLGLNVCNYDGISCVVRINHTPHDIIMVLDISPFYEIYFEEGDEYDLVEVGSTALGIEFLKSLVNGEINKYLE